MYGSNEGTKTFIQPVKLFEMSKDVTMGLSVFLKRVAVVVETRILSGYVNIFQNCLVHYLLMYKNPSEIHRSSFRQLLNFCVMCQLKDENEMLIKLMVVIKLVSF